MKQGDYSIDLRKSVSVFSRRLKLLRLLWNFCWLIVKNLPRKFSPVRIALLRLFGANIGKGCLIESGIVVWLPWKLKMGDFVAIGRKVELYNYDFIEIRSMTVISQYSYLITGTHDYTDHRMPLIWAPITIGSEVWISAGTWVLPGVSIGNGVVIGARSLVSQDVPDWMVCAGHPCKVIKPRIIDK